MSTAAFLLASPALAIAADFSEPDEAIRLFGRLSGVMGNASGNASGSIPIWMKIGLELFTLSGSELVRAAQKAGFPVFLDLKFHDIPHTVKGAVRSATSLGVSMVTLHASGGEAMCRAAVEGRREALAMVREAAGSSSGALGKQNGPLLVGVTVLTSEGGNAEEVRARVVARALTAKAAGLDGVVCSGHEAAAVKEACGDSFVCVCPGIRFAPQNGQASETGSKHDDQARVCTPAQAVSAGANMLVMGRPITRAHDPAAAAQAAIAEMALGVRM